MRSRACSYLPIRSRTCLYLPIRSRACLYLPIRAHVCLYLPIRSHACSYLSIRSRFCSFLGAVYTSFCCFVRRAHLYQSRTFSISFDHFFYLFQRSQLLRERMGQLSTIKTESKEDCGTRRTGRPAERKCSTS